MSNQNILVQSNRGFMEVSTLQQAVQCADLISKSSFCPEKLYGKPGDIIIALQMGQELGLKPMQSLQNIAVINGRPSLWGDAMLAVCRQSPDFEYIKEEYVASNNSYVCRVKRKNEPEVMQSFSEADAKLAKLWGKLGPWTFYPRRMLQMRCRGFALRDLFPDLLRGIITSEEAMDMSDKIDYSNFPIVRETGFNNNNSLVNKDHLSLLRIKIEESESEQDSILDYLKIDKLEEMTIQGFQKVVRVMDKKIAEKKKKELENEVVKQYFESDDESQVEDGSENAQGSIL